MVALFILMNVVFFSYISYVALKYGIQKSISDSYYQLSNSMLWLFTVATWGYAIPAIMIGVSFSPLAFLAGAAICFVGAAPMFKDSKMTNQVHTTGAVIGIIAIQAFIFLILNPYITYMFIGLSLITLLIPYLRQNKLWWIEVFAFLSLTYTYYSLLWQ
jgi:hypothetical protein